MVRLAIDAMGGDNAPKMVLEGLNFFIQRNPDVQIFLYGMREHLAPLLDKLPDLAALAQIVHTDEAITAHTKPSTVLRAYPQASMRLALQAVASGHADAAVSAGNTGAYLALSKLILKTVGGIDRPAIASRIPTQRGESIMLDLGGTLEASSRNLVEYALMGDCFARHVLGEHNPSIGLLNVGREDIKGHDALQQACAALAGTHLNFRGFIEGHDIALGTVSVIVTDGFTGNVALKTGEGVITMMGHALKDSFAHMGLRGKLAAWLARPVLRHVKAQFDPSEHDGALWLGLNGVAVKSHGGTDARGFSHAVEVAYDMVKSDIVASISQAALGGLSPQHEVLSDFSPT